MERSRQGIAVADVVLAGGLVLAGQVELWSPYVDDLLAAARPETSALAVVTAAALAVRRRLPIAAVALASGSVVVQALAVGPAMLLAQMVALLVAVYSVAAHARLALAATGFAVGCAGPVAMALASGDSWEGIASIAVFAGAPWLAGRTLQRVRGYASRLEETTAALEEERRRSAELAVAETRNAIARELHDVLAHGVGVMTLQAGGARRLVDRDPERVRTALGTIERTGREALDELRRLLDGLHEPVPHGGPPADPSPTLVETCERVRDAADGLAPIDVRVAGRPRPLSAGLDLAASRIVQESVSNALRHAPGAPVTVRVAYDDDHVSMLVENGPPSVVPTPVETGRRGLIGMRERAALYAGDLEVGPTADGGYRVRARLPTTARPA